MLLRQEVSLGVLGKGSSTHYIVSYQDGAWGPPTQSSRVLDELAQLRALQYRISAYGSPGTMRPLTGWARHRDLWRLSVVCS